MFKQFLKYLQRRTYTYLGTWLGFTTFILLLVTFSALFWLRFFDPCSLFIHSETPFCKPDTYGNIGGVLMEDFTAYGPIDAVYTWINGSDPLWLAKKELWIKKGEKESSDTSFIESLISSNISEFRSHRASNSSLINETIVEAPSVDDTMSQNRYRDNYELKYSLRSLVKNAPWIRRIYLVTDNQVPSWLNLETKDSRLQIISHEDIFANKSNLPVFSSPAIESQLHNIPGLSRRFIYFNDDVMLGAPVYPDDFISLSGAQKLYTSWDIPKCAPGCSDSWIGDGYCDKACNVSACFFDYPDCVNSTTSTTSSTVGSDSGAKPVAVCAKGCPDTWLGDRVCDQRCKSEECAWDAGDCGIDLVTNAFPGADLQTEYIPQAASINALSGNTTADAASDVFADAVIPLGVILHVPVGTKAIHVNTSALACKTTSAPALCNETERVAFTYTIAEHQDKQLLHTALQISRHHLLVALLYHGQEDSPPVPALPHDILFKVGGKNTLTGLETTVSFVIRVTADLRAEQEKLGLPDGITGMVQGHVGVCSDRPLHVRHKLFLSDLAVLGKPFRVQSGNSTSEGAVLFAATPSRSLMSEQAIGTIPMSILHVHYKITLRSGKSFAYLTTLCAATASIDNTDSYRVQQLFANASMCPDTFDSFIDVLDQHRENVLISRPLKVASSIRSPAVPFLLLLPMPIDWRDFNADWLTVEGSIIVSDNPGRINEWISISSDNNSSILLEPSSIVNCFSSAIKWGHTPLGENISIDANYNNSTNSNSTALLTELGPPSLHPTSVTNLDHRRLLDEVHKDSRAQGNLHFSYVRDDRKVISAVREGPVTPSHAHRLKRRLKRRAERASVDTNAVEKDPDLSLAQWVSQFILNVLGYQTSTVFNRPALPVKFRGRKLIDTYGASLIHVNRLYHKAFGQEQRKVPAHMPHLIDVETMRQMQSQWPAEWNATASHRFRSPLDMQYSFSYYYFTTQKRKAIPPDTRKYIANQIDNNFDGMIDDNEFRTLAAIVYNKSPTPEDIQALRQVCGNFSAAPRTTGSKVHRSNSVSRLGRVVHTSFVEEHWYPSLEAVHNCSKVNTGLVKKVNWGLYLPTHVTLTDSEVAFEMIGDNITEVLSQLDSVRKRQSKFICINDNMKNPTAELTSVLRDFFESFFPMPSQFELSPGHENPTLYLDEYRRMRPSITSRQLGKYFNWSLGYFVSYLSRTIVLTALKLFPSPTSTYDDTATETVSIHVVRVQPPYGSDNVNGGRNSSASADTKLWHFSIFVCVMSVLGLYFIYVIRVQRSLGSRVDVVADDIVAGAESSVSSASCLADNLQHHDEPRSRSPAQLSSASRRPAGRSRSKSRKE